MKKLHLLKTVLLLCALIVGSGNLWAGTITFDFEAATAHRTSGSNSYTGNSYSQNGVTISLTYADAITTGTPLTGTANVAGRVAANTTNSPIVLIGPIDNTGNRITNIAYNIKGVAAMSMTVDYSSDNISWSTLQTVASMPTSATNKEITGLTKTDNTVYLRFTVSVPSSTKSNRDFQLDDIVITYEDASDVRTTTTVIIDNPTTGVYLGDAISNPASITTVKAGDDPVVGAVVTWSSSNTSVATINATTGAISLVGIGSTTIEASYAGNATYKPSVASYTLDVYGVFTTMAELQAGCAAYGTTAKPAKMSFSNVYVTAVKGNYAYISDGTNGAVIYKSGHGFNAGDKLTSTNLVMTIMNYNNYTPEITSLTNTTDGLAVLNGQTITPTAKTIDAITTANFGTLVKITGVTYSAADGGFKDAGDNVIDYYDNFSVSPALVDGGEYDVTGVILFKNSTTVEICPRTAADVVSLKASPETKWYTDNTMTEEITSTTQAINLAEGAVKYYVSTLYAGAVTYESSDDEVATIASDGTITPVRYGMATITVSTPSTATYYASNVSFTLVVKDAKVDILTAALIGQSSYGDWTDKTSYSNTKYAGNSSKKDDAIQLRSSNNNSGIVTTTTEGRARNIIVSWGSETLNERVLNVYGKNTPYSSAADLYSDATQGTLLGTIVNGTSSSLAVTGNYAYIGIRSNDGAVYLDYIAIEWNTSIPVTISSSQYATFCWPSKLDFSGSGLTAFTAESTGSKVELHEITDGIVPANAGVVLYGTAGDHTAEISSAAPTSYEGLNNELVGVNARTSVAADAGAGKTNYILASKAGVVGFYKAAAAGAYLAANKAYLSTTTVSSHEFLGFDGDVTGIADVRGKMEAAKGEYYNLAGQRVAQPTKGLYIVNGKKIIMK